MGKVHPRSAREKVRLLVLAALSTAFLCVGGIFAWASLTEISGAVIASGILVVDSSAKKIQHQNGGIIGEIRVKEGARVAAGEILVHLDETVLGANLAIVSRGLDELQTRQARLTAERDAL